MHSYITHTHPPHTHTHKPPSHPHPTPGAFFTNGDWLGQHLVRISNYINLRMEWTYSAIPGGLAKPSGRLGNEWENLGYNYLVMPICQLKSIGKRASGRWYFRANFSASWFITQCLVILNLHWYLIYTHKILRSYQRSVSSHRRLVAPYASETPA